MLIFTNYYIRKTLGAVFLLGMTLITFAVAIGLGVALVNLVGGVGAGELLTAIVALLGVLGGSVSYFLSKSKEIREGHRQKKIAVYEALILHYLSFLIMDGQYKAPPAVVVKLTTSVLLWASKDVVIAINKIQDCSTASDFCQERYWLLFEELMQVIRGDLGHDKMPQKEILRYSLERNSEGWNAVFG